LLDLTVDQYGTLAALLTDKFISGLQTKQNQPTSRIDLQKEKIETGDQEEKEWI
jgi:hypothetical protein